ncbi:tRNA 2-thiouridine(34) synthase MnmA [Candidatus Microgenomates bacterium]|nr:tRNA 2-thiouridine(34) synthase MnmA [Candidatus Microgenomates bacterium]
MAKTVYVGMSGGVDSSVAAALLVHQGYRVVGVFMKNWTKDLVGITCPWRQDLTDAQSVAAKLGIPLKIYDFQKQYQRQVVDYMIREYKAGFTPNPDIMCNQEIKFKLFLATALADGADMIATGHYSRIRANSRIGKAQLLMAKDKNKDQSYFLYRITQTALAKTLFPVGNLTKIQVRKLAAKFGLPTADKPDSQGICFIGEVTLKEFLTHYIKSKPGPITTIEGEVIGEHDGAAFYTIGQRHGLKVGGGTPYYVIGKDMKTNTLFVTSDIAHEALHRDHFLLSDPHWIDEAPKPTKIYQLRMRYRGNLIDGKLKKTDGQYQIKLSEPERAVTPGQSAVVYSGEKILGGGIITLK